MVILKPRRGHSNSAFRELLDIWEELGLCDVVPFDGLQVWAGSEGDVLLYDFDHHRYLPRSWRVGLFANIEHRHGLPWIYFPRSPRLVQKHAQRAAKGYAGRSIETVFLGRVENHRQLLNRCWKNWGRAIELFEMPIYRPGLQRKMGEYLEVISAARYGLCLAGNGPKCSREIELLAMGTVPIVTPGVGLAYHNKLVEGLHYITVNDPEEIAEKLGSVGEAKWREMSTACKDWYRDNCSPKASFDLTCQLIHEARCAGVATTRNAHTPRWFFQAYGNMPLFALDKAVSWFCQKLDV